MKLVSGNGNRPMADESNLEPAIANTRAVHIVNSFRKDIADVALVAARCATAP